MLSMLNPSVCSTRENSQLRQRNPYIASTTPYPDNGIFWSFDGNYIITMLTMIYTLL